MAMRWLLAHAAHTGADERKGTLTLTSTGGTGTGTATFEIEQIRGSGPLLEVLPPVGVNFERSFCRRGHDFGECGVA